MEEKAFRRPAVAGILNQFVEARLHSDHYDGAIKKANVDLQLALAESYANPIYVTVNPATGVKLAIQQGASLDTTFIKFLEQSLANKDRSGPSVLN